MKLRIMDRILAALAGLILLCAGGALAAQVFFGTDVLGFAGRVLSDASVGRRVILGLAAAGLLLLGLYSLMVLFRHRKKKDRFIRQKTENGELAISMKVLDQMVRKCLEQHPEMEIQGLDLENRRDGLLIRIRSNASGGISIPLTVDALQKEIKQYVTACSGVEISGVRMEIEMSGGEAANAPFAIPAPSVPRLPRETEQPVRETAQESPEEKTETVTEEMPAPQETALEASSAGPAETPVEAEILSAALLSPDDIIPEEEEDDRPMHQRLFSAQPEPCIIPEPPVETEEPAYPEFSEPETETNDADEAAPETQEDTGTLLENDAAAEEMDGACGNDTSEAALAEEEPPAAPEKVENGKCITEVNENESV